MSLFPSLIYRNKGKEDENPLGNTAMVDKNAVAGVTASVAVAGGALSMTTATGVVATIPGSGVESLNPRPHKTSKQYTCTHCSYSADKKVSLNRHMRMHQTSPALITTGSINPAAVAAAAAAGQGVVLGPSLTGNAALLLEENCSQVSQLLVQ